MTETAPLSHRERLELLGGGVALLWIIELVDLLIFGGDLDRYGIRPRSGDGLLGILLSPFLHGGFAHLAANTVPLVVLGGVLLFEGLGRFVGVSLFIVTVGGFGVWLIGGSGTVHIGASGLIFGYLGYLLAAGFVQRSLRASLTSLLVGVLYGGLLWGLLPRGANISWEGHLLGFVAGLVAARKTGHRSH